MTRTVRHLRWLACCAVVMVVAAGCSDDAGDGGDGSTTVEEPSEPRVIEVPGDHATITEAVDAARSGDLVLVSPGVYDESVTVETPGITVRGTDRDEVVLDGGDELENGIAVFSDGVAVENLTVRSYRGNGVLFSGDYGSGEPLEGFRVDHVTAHANGLYGVYAFGSRGGVIADVFASGHPDAGIYVGQCFPCDTVVRDVTSTLNAVGIQATNAGGDLYLITSKLSGNRVGVELTSSVTEQLYPQRVATVAANSITDNDGIGAPMATEVFGVGIVIAGGRGNVVTDNLVADHATVGIILSSRDQFLAESNEVRDNVATGNGTDLAFVSTDGNPLNNCFGGNQFETSSPDDIEHALNCAPERLGGSGTVTFGAPPPAVDPSDVPAPGPQPDIDGDVRSIPNGPATTPTFPTLSDLTRPAR